MSNNKSRNMERCRFFRAKSPYHGAVGGGDSSMSLNDDNLANCWCVKTQGPTAPDYGFVDPTRCVSGRSCFTEPR